MTILLNIKTQNPSPFGSAISEMQFKSDTGGSYRYGFNGEELMNELSGDGMAYDLGERFYDGRLGKMFSLDPLSAQYPWQSPYAYCYNNPIWILDVKGMGGGVELETTPGHGDIRRVNGAIEMYDANVVIKNPDGTETKGAWSQPSDNMKLYISNRYSKSSLFGIDDGKDFTSTLSLIVDQTIYLYSSEGVTEVQTNKFTSFAQEILLYNNILVDFKFISKDEAMKMFDSDGENGNQNILIYDVRNNPISDPGSTLFNVGSKYQQKNENYINLQAIIGFVNTFDLNKNYTLGYVVAHEIYHAITYRVTFYHKINNIEIPNITGHTDGYNNLNRNAKVIDWKLFKQNQTIPSLASWPSNSNPNIKTPSENSLYINRWLQSKNKTKTYFKKIW
jgi:RHS repeat-associated protein